MTQDLSFGVQLIGAVSKTVSGPTSCTFSSLSMRTNRTKYGVPIVI